MSESRKSSARANEEAGATVVPFPGVSDEDGPRSSGVLSERPEDAIEDVDLAELREALEDLRREIRSRFHGESEGGGESGIDFIRLFEEARRRLSTLGMSERSGDVDEFGMDDVVLQRSRRLFDFLHDRYWRVDEAGLEQVPAEGPVLFVANRSGLLPYDGMMLAHMLERRDPEAARARFLVADWLITLPFVQPYLARIGGVRACRENADRLLRTGRSVIAFPEGAKGATKVFRERYQLKRFGRGGVIRTALENGVPLVPVGIVGPEEAHPLIFKWHLPARAIGYPFLPVTPTFPLFGPFGVLPLPTKWVVRFGAPLDLGEPSPLDESPADDPLLLSRLTEDLRQRVDELIQQGLEARDSVWD